MIDPDPLPPSKAPLAPDHIGRYQIVRRLGGGTFGDVYLAHDGVMERPVAVKVPSAWLVATERAKEEFLREARSVAKLQHEGIVRAYDFGLQADGRCYLVFEYIEGATLEERVNAERVVANPLAMNEAARIVAQVAEALHYAHLQGLVHRDIKPANILLDRQGRPKVTDFGLAVREEDLARQRGILAGTLPYMSPEQVLRQGHHLDGRTDIYSLGVVLYELLCGRRPFEAKTRNEVEDQILHREAKPLRQINDSIPAELERICLKALSKRINDRYTTAKDMAEELGKVTRGARYAKPFERQVPAHEVPNLEHLPTLSIASGDQEQTFLLTKDRVIIGRSPDCDLVLNSLAVARYHAQLVRDGSRYLIEDLQSPNGTYLNGHPIRTRVLLQNQDRLHVGGTILVYFQPGVASEEQYLLEKGTDHAVEHKNLLNLIWDSLDSHLQDAFSLAYNKKHREGSNRISTRDFFQALRRISDDSLRTLIESIPRGALPDPIAADIGLDRHLLNANPLLSDCVEDSLQHFIQSAPLPRKLSPVDVFVDIGQHGHGPSVARLREHGVTAEELERRIKKYRLSVLRRQSGE
jgi:serine/threonine protein kinase